MKPLHPTGRWTKVGRFRRTLIGTGLSLLACSTPSETSQQPPARRSSSEASAALIDGDLAPQERGVVWLTHPAQSFVCSGTVVHPELIVTTLHCAFAVRPEGDHVLAAAGFRVGFGPSEEALVFRSVRSLDWVGAPLEGAVNAAVAAGQDVAVLRLTAPVPEGTHIQSIAWDYAAQSEQRFVMVGFGLSSLTLGTNGTRRSATATITGFDPASGIIQLQGRSACFGDSGGPILFGSAESWVGAISQIGGSDADHFCDIGLTFGATVLNPGVRTLLTRAFSGVERCVPEVCGNGQDEDCDAVADNGCAAAGGAGGQGGRGNDPVGGASIALGGNAASGAAGRPPVHIGTLGPFGGSLNLGVGGAGGAGGAGGEAIGGEAIGGEAIGGGGREPASSLVPQLSAHGGCSLVSPKTGTRVPSLLSLLAIAMASLFRAKLRRHSFE